MRKRRRMRRKSKSDFCIELIKTVHLIRDCLRWVRKTVYRQTPSRLTSSREIEIKVGESLKNTKWQRNKIGEQQKEA